MLLEARLGGAHTVVSLSSATHALELAMHLLDLRGGEVIVPSFTFPSVGSAILRAGDVNSVLELVGARRYKTYRIYEKSLTA